MAEDLSTGDVISGTIETLRENQRAAITYIVVLTALGTALEWGLRGFGTSFAGYQVPEWALGAFGIGAGIGGLLVVIISVIAQYLLWENMLGASNFLKPGADKRYFAFFFQALLIGICVGFGFILLIIPGLIFSARWAAAPAFLIAERKGITDGMSASWEMIRGNSKPIILAYLLAGLVIIVLSAIVGGATFFGGAGGVVEVSLFTMIGTQVINSLGTVLAIALGVFLFGRLHGATEHLSDVFE